MLDNAVIRMKASMEAGNAHLAIQKSDTKLNSFVQSLTLVDEFGDQVLVKNLPYYIEIMVESQNPTKPENLITAFQGQADSFKMKPLKIEVSKNSAVFIDIKQLFDVKGTKLDRNATDCQDEHCSVDVANVTIPVGTKNISLTNLNITQEPVVLFVFLNRNGKFPNEQSLSEDDLVCILPNDFEIEEPIEPIKSTTACETTLENPTVNTDVLSSPMEPHEDEIVPFESFKMQVTSAPEKPKQNIPIKSKAKQCKKNLELPRNTCYFDNDLLNLR